MNCQELIQTLALEATLKRQEMLIKNWEQRQDKALSHDDYQAIQDIARDSVTFYLNSKMMMEDDADQWLKDQRDFSDDA